MTATTAMPSAPATSADLAYQHALQLTLQLAVRHHQADQLQEAAQLYRSILQGEPEHAEANHNLGILLLELEQPAALAHFEAALAAMPESERYWLSYLEALIRTGQSERAQDMLAFARQHGLEGDAADGLVNRLNADSLAPEQPGAEQALSA